MNIGLTLMLNRLLTATSPAAAANRDDQYANQDDDDDRRNNERDDGSEIHEILLSATGGYPHPRGRNPDLRRDVPSGACWTS